MLVQGALNGPFTKADHPAVPVSAEELVADAVAVVATGARSIHLHPRDGDLNESLTPDVIDGLASRVRRETGVETGVSTGAWIQPDLELRLEQIRGWSEPDMASVNVSEDGSELVMEAVLDAGVAIEAGVWSFADVSRLAASGIADRVARVLIEPVDMAADEATGVVAAIHAALDAAGITAPRLQHGDGESAWPLIRDAIARGIDTRVGLEDVTRMPDGQLAPGNAALVERAVELVSSRM